MSAGIPEAFERVSLGDDWTWHRATLREWLDMRHYLVEKQKKQKETGDALKIHLQATKFARSQMTKEMGIAGGGRRPTPTGDGVKRHAELMAEYIKREYPGLDPLTEWEVCFLDASTWLDAVLEDYRKSWPRSSTGLLFSWLLRVEDEAELAERRLQKRERNRDAVAPVSTRRLKYQKNPFFPRPIELVQVAIAAEIVVANAARELSVFVSYGDPPGTEGDNEFRVREFMRAQSWNRKPCSFVDDMRRLGYETVHNEIECRQWPTWRTFFLESLKRHDAKKPIEPRATSRELLAWLFEVDVLTIQRYVSKGRLQREYAKHGLSPEYRVYIEKNRLAECANVYRSGWGPRVTQGGPDPRDVGTTFYLLPYY